MHPLAKRETLTGPQVRILRHPLHDAPGNPQHPKRPRVESVVTTANYTDIVQAGEHGWSEVLLTTTPLL
mgnify:CR=1 FL=1